MCNGIIFKLIFINSHHSAVPIVYSFFSIFGYYVESAGSPSPVLRHISVKTKILFMNDIFFGKGSDQHKIIIRHINDSTQKIFAESFYTKNRCAKKINTNFF